jgi:hypothetical protein
VDLNLQKLQMLPTFTKLTQKMTKIKRITKNEVIHTNMGFLVFFQVYVNVKDFYIILN